MASKNTLVRHVWELGTTGFDGEFTVTLYHYADSSTRTAATETVTVAEIGSTGAYDISYTPDNAYPYTGLVVHDGGAAPTYKSYWFDDSFSDAPDAATANLSYASEANVVAYAQTGDYTASTVPTEAQVLGFLEMRSARVRSRLAIIMGALTTGPTGYDVTIDTSTDTGKVLDRVARRAAALGAAADALNAFGAGDTPQQTSRAADLEILFDAALDDLTDPALDYIGQPTRAATHISEGTVSVSTSTVTPQSQGLIMDQDLEF